MEFEEMIPAGKSCTKCKEETRYQANVNPANWIRNNMSRWHEICSEFASADPVKQQAAYETLIALNSQYPDEIPSGMKCTLNFLKVRLQDKMYVAHIVEHQLDKDVEVLRKMYIAAIEEFMDVLASTAHNYRGIYPLSRKFDLPDWLLDIQHQMNHHENKTTIKMLRAATHLCIDWLRDNYWLNESKMAEIWVKLELQVKNELKQILSVLNNCLIYYFQGNKSISSIPDKNLREHVEERCNKYDFPELQDMKQTLLRRKVLSEKDISLHILVLVRDIQEYIKQDSYIHIVENLAEVMLEQESFLPSKELMNILDPMRYETGQCLPLHFLQIWNSILEFLPQSQLVPALIDKLLEFTNKETETEELRELAAVWARTLANSLLAVRDTLEQLKRNPPSDTAKQSLKKRRSLFRRLFDSILRQKISDDGYALLLRPQEVPPQFQQLDNLKRLLLAPTKWTTMYLQSLIFLLEPRLPKQTEMLISNLVLIYTNNSYDGFNGKEFTVHSSEDLKAIIKLSTKHVNMKSEDNKKVPWIHSLEEWGSDPLHYELKILTDGLPGASLWQSDFQG